MCGIVFFSALGNEGEREVPRGGQGLNPLLMPLKHSSELQKQDSTNRLFRACVQLSNTQLAGTVVSFQNLGGTSLKIQTTCCSTHERTCAPRLKSLSWTLYVLSDMGNSIREAQRHRSSKSLRLGYCRHKAWMELMHDLLNLKLVIQVLYFKARK